MNETIKQQRLKKNKAQYEKKYRKKNKKSWLIDFYNGLQAQFLVVSHHKNMGVVSSKLHSSTYYRRKEKTSVSPFLSTIWNASPPNNCITTYDQHSSSTSKAINHVNFLKDLPLYDIETHLSVQRQMCTSVDSTIEFIEIPPLLGGHRNSNQTQTINSR